MKAISWIFLIFALVNMCTLFLIGWGAFYPEYDVIIFFHIICMVLGFGAVISEEC